MCENSKMIIRNNHKKRTMVHNEICGSLISGDMLIVESTQKAVFLKDNSVLSCYDAGCFIWSEENNWPHEGKLYYVDMTLSEEIQWHIRIQSRDCKIKVDLYGSVMYHADNAVYLIRSMAARDILTHTSFEASQRFVKYILQKKLPVVCSHLDIYSEEWYLFNKNQISEILLTQFEMYFSACGLSLEQLIVNNMTHEDISSPIEEILEFNEDIDFQESSWENAMTSSELPEWNNFAGSWMNSNDGWDTSWMNSAWTNSGTWANSSDLGGCNDRSTPQIEQPEKPCDVSEAVFKAASPKQVELGEAFPLNIVMFSDDYRQKAEEILYLTDDARKEIETGLYAITKGTPIRIRLSSPDIAISDDVCEQTWNGKLCVFQFLLEVPSSYSKKTLQIFCRVYAGDGELTDIKLVLKIGKRNILLEKTGIFSAFASYSSKDRAIVAARLQGMLAATHDDLDIFFDVENLRRGEDWENRIKTEIQKRSLFYLFWSRNARNSEWVNKELQYALEVKDLINIEPIPLEPPELCPPPSALNSKHFFDRFLNYTEPPVYITGENSAGLEN